MTDVERTILGIGCSLEDEVERLRKENAELNETVDANLRVHRAAEKADSERIWKLQEENERLRSFLREAVGCVCNDNECSEWYGHTGCLDRTECKARKWRSALDENGTTEN